jgi:hypothetical protein
MSLLDDLFSRFDALCNTHGVYKVETIGDCCACPRASSVPRLSLLSLCVRSS